MSENLLKLAGRLNIIAEELESKEENESVNREVKKYRLILNKIKDPKVLSKIEVLLEKPMQKKPDLYWAKLVDKSEGSESFDIEDFVKRITPVLRRNMGVADFLRKLLVYGVDNGHTALKRILGNNRVKMTLVGD